MPLEHMLSIRLEGLAEEMARSGNGRQAAFLRRQAAILGEAAAARCNCTRADERAVLRVRAVELWRDAGEEDRARALGRFYLRDPLLPVARRELEGLVV